MYATEVLRFEPKEFVAVSEKIQRISFNCLTDAKVVAGLVKSANNGKCFVALFVCTKVLNSLFVFVIV
jgi:hypothetical protein